MEEEYEQRIIDLTTDLGKLRETLHEAEEHHRMQARDRSALCATLSEQNQRLTSELREGARREQELRSKLEELRARVNDKRVTMQDHVAHLETLKDEVSSNLGWGSVSRFAKKKLYSALFLNYRLKGIAHLRRRFEKRC